MPAPQSRARVVPVLLGPSWERKPRGAELHGEATEQEQPRGKSPAPRQEKEQGFGSTWSRVTYPQEALQEFPGAVDVDAGDVAVAPQHAVHRGGHVLPVLLRLGVELKLILHHLARHAGPAGDSLLFQEGEKTRVRNKEAPPQREAPQPR